MCFFTTSVAALLGLSVLSCDALPASGPDPSTETIAVPVDTTKSRVAYHISCPRGTASCLSRAEAICGGRFKLVSPAGRAPRVQALVNLKMTVIDTANPFEITVTCE